MLKHSFLTKSRQLWKLLLAVPLMALGLFATVWSATHVESYKPGLAYFFGGLALGFVAMIWLALSVRCPQCGVKLIWRAATTGSAGDWLGELLRSGSCPSCGFEPVRD